MQLGSLRKAYDMDKHEAVLGMITVVALTIGVIGYNYVQSLPATECAKAGKEFTIDQRGAMTCKK